GPPRKVKSILAALTYASNATPTRRLPRESQKDYRASRIMIRYGKRRWLTMRRPAPFSTLPVARSRFPLRRSYQRSALGVVFSLLGDLFVQKVGFSLCVSFGLIDADKAIRSDDAPVLDAIVAALYKVRRRVVIGVFHRLTPARAAPRHCARSRSRLFYRKHQAIEICADDRSH